MESSYFKWILLVMAVVLSLMSVNAVSAEDNLENSLNSSDNYEQSLENAKVENKSIVLVFDQKSCSWCEVFKRNTLENQEVIDNLNSKFITVIVDINKNPEVASKYSVYGTPTIIFLDSNANEIKRNEGYLPPDEFLEVIKGI